jgi:hypothetical protein
MELTATAHKPKKGRKKEDEIRIVFQRDIPVSAFAVKFLLKNMAAA